MKKFFQGFGSDFSSSVVVFLVAIPLCLGIAVASGVNEISGIIAGVVGGVVVGFLSGSNLSVSGPAAGLTAIVSASIMKLPSLDAFFLAVFIAGFIQILMGILRLGVIGDYIPNSVIKGMLAAIGIILILKQFPHLVGYDKDYEGDEAFIQFSGENTFSSILNSINYINPLAVIIGVVGILVLVIYETGPIKKRRFFQILSGPLFVVILSVLINKTFGSIESPFTSREAHLVNIPVAASYVDFLSFLNFPGWGHIWNPSVWISAITIALVASLETLLGIEAVDKLDPLKRVTPPNKELVAQGAGNIVSGLLGGLPLTSVIVRSSANVNAGAKTKNSTILHGILILFCVLFFPDILNMIPKAGLAAILIFTGYKLAKPSLFVEFYKKGRDQIVPFVVTIFAIVMTDLLKGVLLGIGVGVFYIIRVNFRNNIISVQEKNNMLIRLRKDVSFFTKPLLKEMLEKIPPNINLVIDLTQAEQIDRDVIDTINDFLNHANLKNISCLVKKNSHNPLHQLINSD